MIASGLELWLSLAVLIAIAVSVSAICLKQVPREEPSKDAASLREAYSELAAVYAHVPVVLIVVDEQLRVEKVNDLAARFAGREMSNMLGLPTAEAVGGAPGGSEIRLTNSPCRQSPVRAAILDTLHSGISHHHIEGWLPIAVDGQQEQRCLLVSTALIEVDHVRKVLVCAQDVTELKLAQVELLVSQESITRSVRDLESSLAEKTVLIQEIHHRVKNNLAVISSLLGLKADSVKCAEARVALEESRQRVHSMALIHEHLYGNDRLDRVDFAEYARQLVQILYSSTADRAAHIAIEMNLEPIELGIERAVPCALILNELLSNAFKYAFPGRPEGKISIRFGAPEPRTLELVVEDNGVGLPVGRLNVQQSKSLGLRIVAILAEQLDGSIDRNDAKALASFSVSHRADARNCRFRRVLHHLKWFSP